MITHPLGHSVDGRPINAIELGDPHATTRVLVVGYVHGNKRAGLAILANLEQRRNLPDVDLWIVPTFNPDGGAANTRQNARGVDLNRNFPYRWQASGRRGDVYYPGPRAASEPETQLAMRLIERIHPTLTIWYHQHLRVVDADGGDEALERQYAKLVGLPLTHLPAYHGEATRWQMHVEPGTTAFVVELPAGSLGATAARRYASAMLTVASSIR